MKKIREKPVVGQKLWIIGVNGYAARSRPFSPVKVVLVGRKYFTAKVDDQYGAEYEFHIDEWRHRTNSSAMYLLYASEEERAEELEFERTRGVLHVFFDYNSASRNLPLSALREIMAIVDRHTAESPSV